MPLVLSGDGITSDNITSLAASKLTGQVPDANAPSGSVIQVVSVTKTDSASGTNTQQSSWSNVLSASITPISSSNKILIIAHLNWSSALVSGDASPLTRLARGSTAICIGDAAGSRPRTTTGYNWPGRSDMQENLSITFLDSPGTTSSTTYNVQIAIRGVTSGGTWYVNRSVDDGNNVEEPRTASTITLMEIAA